MRFLLAIALVAVAASSPHAEDYPRNAWGLTASPMASELTGDGLDNREVGASDMSLGLGAFYHHVFSRRLSGRFELSGRQNHYGTYTENPPLVSAFCTVLETTIESVIVVSFDRHVDMAGHDARFSVGTGPVVSAVVEQTVGKPLTTSPPFEGSYGKFGWMFEGGLALGLDSKLGIFARFRAQNDYKTFSESDDADIVRKLNSFGFLVGAEFGF